VKQTNSYVAAMCLLGIFCVPSLGSAQTMTTCEDANPFDRLPDHVALQACLDNYDWVLLKPDYLPDYVGYLVGDTIKIKRAGALLTTADNPHKALILADPAIVGSMLSRCECGLRGRPRRCGGPH
jgi:hypothetical protein